MFLKILKSHNFKFKKMKKNFTLAMIFFSVIAFSQVGINTPNPQGILHVDGAKDNPATGSPTDAQQANDFTVTSAGNVGIGNTTPLSNLHIKTGEPLRVLVAGKLPIQDC